MQRGLKSRGAATFIKSRKTEIIPFIDRNYKTNTDRGFMRHYQGGLFTIYGFMNSNGYFTRFGINSLAFYWDNENL